MLARLQQRMSREEGFTLIELLVVIVISGSCSRSQSRRTSASRIARTRRPRKANIRAAVPSAEAYYADTPTGTYVGDGPRPL